MNAITQIINAPVLLIDQEDHKRENNLIANVINTMDPRFVGKIKDVYIDKSTYFIDDEYYLKITVKVYIK